MKRVLLLGCGDLGSALGLRLLADGHEVRGVRRDISRLPAGLPGVSLDYAQPGALAPLLQDAFDTVVMTPTPAGRDEAGYRAGYLLPVQNLLAAWPDGSSTRLIYISSTRVYGDHNGDWVDENTSLRPADAKAALLAEAESRLLSSDLPVSIVRFPGIYGRQPSALLERVRRGCLVAPRPPRFSNRIHREDCVGFMQHLLALDDPASLYLAGDDAPTLQREVEEWLARCLGVTPVEEIAPRGEGHRRCRNARMKASGYELQFPDYRAGYSAMISSTSMSTPFGSAAT